MTNKTLKYGLWTLLTIIVIGPIIFLTTFGIFETPSKKVLISKCDYEGLRSAEVYRLEGNAVTRPSIHVYIYIGCYKHEQAGDLIFVADNVSIDDNDVNLDWVTFDTLAIAYKSGLRIFTQRDRVGFADSILNLNVKYNWVE